MLTRQITDYPVSTDPDSTVLGVDSDAKTVRIPRSTLIGPQGPTGAQGPAGPAGGAVMGWRNMVVNGDFSVQVRGAAATVDNAWPIDRWQIQAAGAGATRTWERLADPDRPGAFLLQAAVAGVDGTAFEYVHHKVEGLRRLHGQTLTLSYQARVTSGSGALYASGARVFGTGGSPSGAESMGGNLAALSTTWATFTVTFNVGAMAGKTFGSNGDDHVRLSFYASVGSFYAASAPGLGVRAQTVQIRNVSLEIGAATAFEPRPLHVEEALCARYYRRAGRGLSALARTTTALAVGGTFDPPMRAAPSASLLSTTPAAIIVDATVTGTASALSALTVDRAGFRCALSGFTGLTAGQPGFVSTSDLIAFDAEL